MKSNDSGPFVVFAWAAVLVWVMVSTVLYVVSETHTETVLQQMVGVGRWAGSNVAAYVFARAITELS